MKTLKIKNITIGEGVPKIIVPLMGKTDMELLEEIATVKSVKPDIVEWRADIYEGIENLYAVTEMITKLRNALPNTPILFTFRSHKEGGNKEISDQYYFELMHHVIETKMIDLVDIELFNEENLVMDLVEEAKKYGVYVIMSNHDFHQTPTKDEILSRLCKMQELGAHIPKIAVMPQSVEDVIILLDATYTMASKFADRPIITMSMAGTGLVSRLAGEVFGSSCTFGSGKEASAPGQIPVESLRTVLNIIDQNM